MTVDAWEPITFSVGDRVRVRLSAECRQDWGNSFSSWHPKVIGHPVEFDGTIGRIDLVRDADDAHGHHRYGVLFGAPVSCPHCPSPAVGGWFAASELETDR